MNKDNDSFMTGINIESGSSKIVIKNSNIVNKKQRPTTATITQSDYKRRKRQKISKNVAPFVQSIYNTSKRSKQGSPENSPDRDKDKAYLVTENSRRIKFIKWKHDGRHSSRDSSRDLSLRQQSITTLFRSRGKAGDQNSSVDTTSR